MTEMALLERWGEADWLPVSITRNGQRHHGSYAVADEAIVVISCGRTVSTWVAPTTNVRGLARQLLHELAGSQ